MLQTAAKPVTKWILLGCLISALLGGGVYFGFQSLQKNPAATHEVTKIFKALSFYQQKHCKLVYNDNVFELSKAIGKARYYIVANYHGEPATAWVQKNLYRTPDANKIIYLVFPDGSRRPLRDALLEALNLLFPV